jgi:hypothetical protein
MQVKVLLLLNPAAVRSEPAVKGKGIVRKLWGDM